MNIRKYIYFLIIIAVFFICLIFIQNKSSNEQVLQHGVYMRQDSSSIGYVVINKSIIGGGQQIIARDSDGKLIDQGSIRFKENKGIINMRDSSRNVLWVNNTAFTSDDENVIWIWTRNFEPDEIRITR